MEKRVDNSRESGDKTRAPVSGSKEDSQNLPERFQKVEDQRGLFRVDLL